MTPEPQYEDPDYQGSGKLRGKVVLITGGDSGIGRATAILFAKEGADVAIVYLEEDADAEVTASRVRQLGQRCLSLRGDVRNPEFCSEAIERTVSQLGRLNILINNAGVQYPQENPEDISIEQFKRTFETNIFAYFYLIKSALPHLDKDDTIINVTSVTAYRGSGHLVDYASTKGAIAALTRSLAKNLAERGIRVNGVAPGPIWSPLIPSSFEADYVAKFGTDTPLGRPGQPREVAPSFVFLASSDSSYMTGQVLHPNGGQFVHS